MTDLKPDQAPALPPPDDSESSAIPLAAVETNPATPGRFRDNRAAQSYASSQC